MGGHKFNPSIIDGSIFRGVYGSTLEMRDAYVLGLVAGTRMHGVKGAEVCLTHDGRISSPGLHRELVRGLFDSGAKIMNLGFAPSPVLYFLSMEMNFELGIQVTASSAPAEHNGFRFFIDCLPAQNHDIERFVRMAASGNWQMQKDGVFLTATAIPAYMTRLMRNFALPPMKIVWDAGHGAMAPLIAELAETLKGEHLTLNAEPNGRFPDGAPDPLSAQRLERLGRAVIESGSALGFCFDGDGDRLAVADEQGRLIPPEHIALFLAQTQNTAESQNEAHELPVLHIDPLFAAAMPQISEAWQIERLDLPINTRMIKGKPAHLAADSLGHIAIGSGYYGFADGLYAALCLMAADPEILRDWLTSLPALPASEIQQADLPLFVERAQLHRRLCVLLQQEGWRIVSGAGWLHAEKASSRLAMRNSGRRMQWRIINEESELRTMHTHDVRRMLARELAETAL